MLKDKRVIKLIAVVTVILSSMFMLTGCGNVFNKEKNNKDKDVIASSYETPIKNIVEGLSEANPTKFLSAFPSFIAQPMKSIFTEEYLKGTLEDAKEEYGENIVMSYIIVDKESIDKEELEEIVGEIKDSFDEDVEITEGYEVNVKITTKGDDKEDSEEDSFKVYNIDGDWYILNL